MKLKTTIQGKWSGGFMGALLATLAAFLLVGVQVGREGLFGKKLVRLSYDIPFAFRADLPLRDDVVIVYIDEESHEFLGQDPLEPWDRQLHADLLNRLTRDKAKVVVFDILFVGNPDPEATANLAAAMKAHGNVVIGNLHQLIDKKRLEGSTTYEPEPEISEAAAAVGDVNLLHDEDYVVREEISSYLDFKTLPWVAASRAGAELQPEKETEGLLSKLVDNIKWVNFYGPPGYVPSVSYHMAIDEETGMPEGYFKDKVVFVGAAPILGDAGDTRDTFNTPYTWHTGMSTGGVEIHVASYLNLLNGDWFRRLQGPIELLFLLFTGTIFGFFLCRFRPLQATLVALPSMLAVGALHQMVFAKLNFWFPWMIVAAVQIPVALFWSMIVNSLRLFIDKLTLMESIQLHLSPARAKQIIKHPHLLKPGAEEREVTIMFTDIENFSKITGRMNPSDLFQLLNNYFEMALGCTHKNEGTVIKLIGDAIFAVWNAPFDQTNHAELACRAALSLRASLIEFDLKVQSLPLKTRIGLHTGRAYIGNVGSTSRFDYTAIGDSINLASRLEGLNKFIGTDVLATRDTERLVGSTVVGRLIGHFRFKGFDRVVEVHELVGPKEDEGESKEWRETFEKGLFFFQRTMFDEAEEQFKRTQEIRGGDGASRFYLDEIARWRSAPPPSDWAGEVNVTEK